MATPLHLPVNDFRYLLSKQGPSLGLWRAAEVAVLRQQTYRRPVLDLGCGDGLVTSLVLPCVDIGLDPNAQALRNAAWHDVYLRLEAVPVEEADLPPASVGTVISNSVLEHVENLDEVLRAVARLLRPDGRFVFTTPTEAFSRWLALPLGRYAAWRNRQLVHHNLRPAAWWQTRLARAGLEVETVQPYLRPGLVRTWDLLELMQQIWIGRQRLFSLFWRRLSPGTLDRLAQRAAALDLSAGAPGGGRLIVAQKMADDRYEKEE